jgi:PAS domain S-box-containing protein
MGIPGSTDAARRSPLPGINHFVPAGRWRDGPWVGYAVAVVTTAAALGLTWLAQGELHSVIFVLFFLAVILTAWIGGRGPALLAIVLALLGVDYFFIAPIGRFAIGARGDIAPLVSFALVCAVVSWLIESQRRISREIAGQARQFHQQNIALENQVEESQALQEDLERTRDALATANRALTRNREFLEQAQESAQLGSWDWDIKANTVGWSAQMFRVYGLEPGSVDVSFEAFIGLVHPDDREIVQQKVGDAVRTGQPFALDHRVVWPDGSVRWLHGRGRVIVDAGGEPVRMAGSGQDITERRRALEAQLLLSRASETLAASLDYGQTLTTLANLVVREHADWCSIAIGDETGRYSNLAVAHRDPERVQWAEEYSRLNPPRFDTPTGVPNVLRTGRSEFYPEITRELLLASVQTAEEMRVIDELQMRSAMVVPMVARGRTIGAISLIGTESRPPFTPDDLQLAEQLASHAAIAIDNARLFEESRVARADAEAANRAKAQFLAAMSHELRTPLNAIAGYAELIELEVLGPVTEKQRDAIERVQRSRRHLSGLVDQVLSFARIEAGKIEFDLTSVPVNDAVHKVAEMIAPQAAGRSLRYQFDGCAADIAVRADHDRLDQIVLNLLANAVKFTPAGGAVRVTVVCDLISVRINVIDTGPGIPLDKREAIFQPFVQLASRTDALVPGVGLGLAISRDLARAMGGDISVSNNGGAGAVFTVRLPRSSPAVSEQRSSDRVSRLAER